MRLASDYLQIPFPILRTDSNVCGIITLCHDTVSDTDVSGIRLWWPEIRWLWFNCKGLISFSISTKNALSKTKIIKRCFILLSLFVGWCTECRNVHDVSIIKDAFLYSHLFYVFTLRNYLLYSTQQSPFWDANRFSASQEIPRILWNPKVHCRIHKCPLRAFILIPINLVHAPIPLPDKVHFNIILSCVGLPGSFSLSQISPPKSCTHLSSPPYVLHGLPISFFFRFDHLNNIWRGVQM